MVWSLSWSPRLSLPLDQFCEVTSIEPLGEPAHNAVKYYALADVEELGRCHEKLSVATKAIYSRNKSKTHGVCAQDAADNLLICEFVVGGN